MKTEKGLFVATHADGKMWGWDGMTQFGSEHNITTASQSRICNLTFDADKYVARIIYLSPSLSILNVMRRMPSPKPDNLGLCNDGGISDEMVVALAASLGTVRGMKGFHISEVTKIVRWAEDVTLSYTLLQSILMGYVNVDVREDGELVFLAGEEPDDLQQ